MTALLKLIAAMARVLEEFAENGGVEIMIDAWRAQREQSKAQARLADEQRLASALARGDLDAIESHAHGLLVAADRANRDRAEAGDLGGSRGGDGDGKSVAVDGAHADAETLQREIDALLRR